MDLVSQLGRRFKFEFLGRVIYAVFSSLLTVALARLLNPDGYGLLFFAISVLGVFKLFARLGIGKSTGKYIATYRETDSAQLRHILRFGFQLNMFFLIVVVLVILFFNEAIAELVGEPDVAPFLLVGCLYVFFSTVDAFARKGLQGFEEIEITGLMKTVRGIAKFIFSIVFVLLGFGALGAFVGYSLGYVIAGTFGIGYLYIQHYRDLQLGTLESGLRKQMAKYAVPLTASDSSAVIDNYFDTILVGFFLGPVAVSFYTIGKQVISFVRTPAAALGFTVSPSYESQNAAGNTDTAARIYEEALNHTLILYTPAAAGLILISEPLILQVFGQQYLGAVPVLQVLAIYLLFGVIVQVTGPGLDFLGRARARAVVRFLTAGMNVILNIVLIPAIGVTGAAVATVVTYGFYMVASVYIMSLELDLRRNKILHTFGASILVTIAMSAVVSVALTFVTGLITLIVVMGVGVGVWAVLVARLGILDMRRVASAIF